MATSISNNDNVIDSRDVIARIEELENMREYTCPECKAMSFGDTILFYHEEDCTSKQEPELFQEAGDAEELAALLALQSEAEGYASDWRYGETLIRDSYFEDYAQELASDLYGKEVSDTHWPFTCIDWEKAAEELQYDYTSVEFDGVTYWVR
jgi:hypothetical protein